MKKLEMGTRLHKLWSNIHTMTWECSEDVRLVSPDAAKAPELRSLVTLSICKDVVEENASPGETAGDKGDADEL